jgi:dihydroxyacetone kinase
MERNMRTLAVAVTTATHPSTRQPIFELADDDMEIGMGQHGEAFFESTVSTAIFSSEPEATKDFPQ